MVKRFDICYVELDPTAGSEINKTRPCMVISPDEMNNALNTVIVAPLTSTIRNYPMRVNCTVAKKKGQIALDQIRTIDKLRLKTYLGKLDAKTAHIIVRKLSDMFSL